VEQIFNIDQLLTEINDLRATIAELAKAAEPFLRATESWSGIPVGDKPIDVIYDYDFGQEITCGMVSNLAAAVEKAKGVK
jgi:hypothetical protein